MNDVELVKVLVSIDRHLLAIRNVLIFGCALVIGLIAATVVIG